MNKLSTINEAIEYINKLHNNDNFYCLILHRNSSTNIRTILGTIKCNNFKIKHINNFDITISLYDNSKSKTKSKTNTLQGNTGVSFSKIDFSMLEAKSDYSNSPKIVDLAIYGLRIINITDYSADFISSNGFDFSYVIKAPDSDMNLMTEWIFGRNVPSKATWIHPNDTVCVKDELMFKKKLPKNRFLDI